jgi:hypothetical protein
VTFQIVEWRAMPVAVEWLARIEHVPLPLASSRE